MTELFLFLLSFLVARAAGVGFLSVFASHVAVLNPHVLIQARFPDTDVAAHAAVVVRVEHLFTVWT